MRNTPLIIASVVLGIAFLVISVIYFTHTAGNLPSFFPGHEAGSLKTHTKHGIAALVLGLGGFVIAWFQSGPRKSSAAEE